MDTDMLDIGSGVRYIAPYSAHPYNKTARPQSVRAKTGWRWIMPTTILEGIRNYFLDCPLMADNKLNIDYLPADAKQHGVEYCINVTPAEVVIESYIHGGAKCQYAFAISSVADYQDDVLRGLSNNGFYEHLTQWLGQQTRRRLFPELPDGLQSLKIEAQSAGHLFSTYEDSAKYQIQCRLVYYRKGDF